MEIKKANFTISSDHINMSMPITKVDRERRIVTGWATLDNLDRQMDVVPSEASVKAFENFRGNIREMHQPIAVGKVVSFKEDTYFDQESKKFYNGIVVSAYVSKGAQDTWEKVLDGTLTGFSIGGEINETEDVFDEEMNKAYRVIKEYSLSELSLVDNPANQFANIVSIEKVDGKSHMEGYLSKATIENVFWCRKDDIIQMSYDSNRACPQCDKAMNNIGFVESNDMDKASVVKSIIKSIKKSEIMRNVDEGDYVKFDGQYGKVIQVVYKGGARLSSQEVAVLAKSDDPVVIIKSYSQIDGTIVPTNRRVIKNISSLEKVNAISKSEVKEVSKMDSDIVVVDEIEKGVDFEGSGDDQINPEKTALPVEEVTTQGAETVKADMPEVEKAIEIEVTEEDESQEDTMKSMVNCKECGMECSSEEMKDGMCQKCYGMGKAEMPTAVSEEDVNATTKMISEIADSLTSTLSTLAETVKALDAKIEGINKSVAGLSNEVNEVKDSFGKRVDAVEKDTAFRKSADLGEILQEEPVMEKSMTSTWGGRFLTNADLF
jgi:hypothetical protein